MLSQNYPGRVAGAARGTATVETAIGSLGVEATVAGITRVRLPGGRPVAPMPADGEAATTARNAAAQLAEYVHGQRRVFELALDWAAVPGEHRRLLETLTALAPHGHTVTYGELGARSGVDDPREVGVYT